MASSLERNLLQGTSMQGAHYKSTDDQYLKIVVRLYRKAEHKRSRDPEMPATVSNLDVVNDLIAAASSLRASTWRLYRAALRHHLEILYGMANVSENRRAAIQCALNKLNGYQLVPAKNLPHRTTSNRKRTVNEHDFGRLICHLNSRRPSMKAWPMRVANWMLAGLVTGLRPAEWEHARLIDDTHLAVITAKRKGQTPAELLSLELDMRIAAFMQHQEPLPSWVRIVEIEPSDCILVKMHLKSLRELHTQGHAFTDIYDQCRYSLRRACTTLWGGSRGISLYSARGQFAANAKAIMPLAEVSKLMGHTSTRTTQSNYGKRRSAHARFKQAPSVPSDAVRRPRPDSPAPPIPEASSSRS